MSFPDRVIELGMAIGRAIEAADRRVENFYLAGEELEENPYDRLVAGFRAAIELAEHHRDHVHDWDEHDRCRVCCADGRA